VKSRIKDAARRVAHPLAAGLQRLGVTPNQVTFVGLLLTFAAAWALAQGRFPLATALLLVGSVCDMLDGDLARLSGNASRFGAFLDSTIDRYAELALFFGAALYFAAAGEVSIVAATFLAASGSILVSYARARAEGLGLECKVGLMERPERLVVLILATAFGPVALTWALWGLAGLTHATAIQRIVHVQRTLRSATGAP
jgi:CDP-diacylglycerol--glycerol-3-phosphate 3-phosphatidyltransferase